MSAVLLALALAAAPAQAASEFVENFRKAEARSASDPERVEFATRALRAWLPKDGSMLRAQAYYRRAEGLMAALEPETAELDLAEALAVDPNNHAARLLRARALVALGRGLPAEKEAAAYLQAAPQDAEGFLVLGQARLARGMPASDAPAREAFSRAAAILGPDDARPDLGIARAYLSARKPREALPVLQGALERPGSSRPDLLSTRGRAYAALGDWKGAREDLLAAGSAFERKVEQADRSAGEKARASARAELADILFRRAVAEEALSLKPEALSDHRRACDLGSPPACARAEALEASLRTPATTKPPKPKRRPVPKGDAGDRIYAN